MLALMFASLAVTIVVIMVIGARVSKGLSDDYYAPILVRLVALLFDILILRILAELLWSVLVPNYNSYMFASFIYLPVSFMLTLFAAGAGVVTYLIPYFPILGMMAPLEPSLLSMLLGFFYFFLFDAFYNGRTIGRVFMKIETQHESENRRLTYREAYYNAVGKSFILVDIIVGQIASMRSSSVDGKKQVRYTQKLAGIVTKDSMYRGESGVDNLVDAEVQD
jgi:hypothetical protein